MYGLCGLLRTMPLSCYRNGSGGLKSSCYLKKIIKMSKNQPVIATLDGNEAVAYIAYRVNEVCAIYPITPASTMAEFADEWSAANKLNIWGNVPEVIEM